MTPEGMRARKGQTIAEYAVILAIIALAVIGALFWLTGNTVRVMSSEADNLTSPPR